MLSEHDSFEELCSVWFDDPKRGIIAVLVVYSDASYNHRHEARPAEPLLHTVGCYVAHVDDWRKFRKEWRGELSRANLEYFHQTEFDYAQNAAITGKQLKPEHPYYGWKPDQFVPFQRRLHQVLRRGKKDAPRLVGFVSSMIKKSFDDWLPDMLKDDPGCKSHYMFNVAINMESIRRWADFNNLADEIHYVFAGGDNETGNLEKWFDALWKDDIARKRYRLSKGFTRMGFDVQWMKGEPALQAADVAAYEFNKLAIAAFLNDGPIDESKLRKSVVNLCREPQAVLPLILNDEGFKLATAEMEKFKAKHGGAWALV